MKPNEEYWLELYKQGLIEVDPEYGIIYSWLSNSKDTRRRKEVKRIIGAFGNKRKDWYLYLSAGPSRKERYNILAHRFVWIVFKGEIPDGYEINHINGIKNDNRLCNLELVTKSENELHKRRVLHKKGGTTRGEHSSMSKLTWEDVLDIRWLWNERVRDKIGMGVEFGVTQQNINHIVFNRTWKNESECKI